MIIEKNCDNLKFSSNINEVIREVLNFLLFFLRKDFARTKSTKGTKGTKRTKRTKRIKSTKKLKKHKNTNM